MSYLSSFFPFQTNGLV